MNMKPEHDEHVYEDSSSLGEAIEEASRLTNITVTKTTEVIKKRDRSPANLYKVEILRDFLNLMGEEDVDSVFVTLLTEMQNLGYNLQDEPGALLERIKRQFNGN
jgi:hypothetical protein